MTKTKEVLDKREQRAELLYRKGYMTPREYAYQIVECAVLRESVDD
jgi:hypothetical protein